MAKVLGQFLFATTLMQMVPVDAAYLEWQAGASTDIAEVQYHGTEQDALFMTLPEAENRFDIPVKVDLDSHGIVTTAQSALVVDRDSGTVLFQKHPDEVRSIASVTKLMTALVFLEQGPDLSQIVELAPELDYVAGGRVYLGYYNGLELEDVLAASLIGSDNTATSALVRFSGLSEDAFIDRMNELAAELGMVSAHFADPTGVDGENRSSARDLVKLLEAAEANEIISDYTQRAQMTVTQATGRTVTIENTNKLLTSFLNLSPYDVLGGKTGYLPEAGYVLATTIEEGDHAVHVLVLGSESKDARVDEVKGLAYWAFKTFSWE